MPVLPRKDLTEALRASLSFATGRPFGILAAPKPLPGATAPAMPYAILYPISGGAFSGPMPAPHEDVDAVYQVTSVGGKIPGSADWLADRVRRAVLERSDGSFVTSLPGPDGWIIDERWPDAGLPALEEEIQGLYQVAERFVFRLTPA